MKGRERIAFFGSLVVLLAVAAYVAVRFKITTEISALMPDDGNQKTLSLVRQVAESELGRTMVLTLSAPDAQTTLRATREFESALRTEPGLKKELAALDGGPSAGSERAIYELYHKRRFSFLADTPEAARALLTPEALSRAASALKEKLAQPMSALIGRVAPSDPLQVLPGLFERLASEQGGALRIEDGRFVTQDGRFGVLFLRTHARGLDSHAQAPVLAGIAHAFAAVNARYQGKLVLDQSGVNRFAVRAEQTISGDLSRVSTLATVGLLLLMFLLFRSLRLLLIASLPLGAGTLVGIASCLLVYGSVHGITLAFGAALLGVALDYVEHLYCHHAVAPHPGGPRATLTAIGPSLITGAFTTLVGFLALGGSGIRGLEEVALFSSAGLVTALLTTFTMLPAIIPQELKPVALRTRVVERLGELFDALQQHRGRLWILPALSLLITALGATRLSLGTDATMGQLDPELVAEDARVRGRVARYENMRFVLAVGNSEEAALEVNDKLEHALSEARAANEVNGYRNIALFLPSAARQTRVQEAVRSSLGTGEPLLAAFEQAGFRREAFAPFQASLAAPAPEPLRFRDLAGSPLAGLVGPFRIALPEGVAFLSFLQDVKQVDAFERRIEAISGARFVDQQAALQSTHALYQERTLELVLLGVLGVLFTLALRYRDFSRTFSAFLPSVLAAAVTVSVLGLLGRSLDLVAMAALLMVISMGVDYGVFLVDASESSEERTVALLSVFLAATTSVLGFGLLALSQHPLLSAIGITATVGMTACLLLAPTTLILLGAHKQKEVA